MSQSRLPLAPWREAQPAPTAFADLKARFGRDGLCNRPGHGRQIDLWLVATPSEVAAIDRAILAPVEIARAHAIRLTTQRNRFLSRRSTLRRILALYLGLGPEEVGLAANRTGRPMVDGQFEGGSAPTFDTGTLQFSLSQTVAGIAIAVAGTERVGIDAEPYRPQDNAAEIAELFFTETERAALPTDDANSRDRAMCRLWTAKEALLKALNYPPVRPLAEVEVAMTDGGRLVVGSLFGDATASARWSLVTLDPWQDVSATLAVEGHGWVVVERRV